jgi:hypothetical protein
MRQASSDRQRHAPAHSLQRLRVQQPLDRGPHDARRGAEDQQALEAGGEVLRLVVPEGVFLVRRRRGDRHDP